VTFGIHVLFNHVHTVTVFGGPIPVPTVTSLDWFALIVAAAGFIALTRFKVNVLWVIAASAVAGVIRALA
jgi:hypothetical protein